MSQNLTQATLCIAIDKLESKILLGMKNKAKFGGGNYNGAGGRVKEGEVIEQAAIRELEEESGLKVNLNDLDKVAELTFYFPAGQEKFNQIVHIYKISRWHGNIKNSDEMIWRWFSAGNIPYSQMWDGDKYWLPQVLAGKRLKGTFYFDNNRKVKNKELMEIGSF